MHKLHLWVTSDDTGLDIISNPTLSLQDHLKLDLITQDQSFDIFLENLRVVDSQFSVSKFLANRWQQEGELEMVEKDYAGNSTYKYHRYSQDKVLHLIMNLGIDCEYENFALLDSLSNQDFEKVVLHLFTTTVDALSCWNSLQTKLSQKDDNILSKVVLGSVSDIATITDTKSQYFSLLPRLMYEPTLASENEQYLSIDEYLKIHYGTHYYLSLDCYKPSFWQSLQSTQEISKLLELIISSQSTNTIFPTDNPEHRIELNDEVLFVNYNQPKLLNLYPLLLEIDEVFGLHTFFFATNSDKQFDLPSLFKSEIFEASNIQLNIDTTGLDQYPKWLQEGLLSHKFGFNDTFHLNTSQLLLGRFDLTNSSDLDRLKLSLIDTQVTGDKYLIINLNEAITSSQPGPVLNFSSGISVYYPKNNFTSIPASSQGLYEDQFWRFLISFFTDSN